MTATDRTNEPSQDHRGTARHNNNSPCTDGEVAEMVNKLRSAEVWNIDDEDHATGLLLIEAADLLTSLSAERDRLEGELEEIVQALRFRGAVVAHGPVSWVVAIAIDTAKASAANAKVERDQALARAERAEAERDALKAEKHELMCSGLALMGDLKAAKDESDALKATVAEVLEPFASATRDADDSRVKDTAPTWESPMAACVTFGDFRRAAELHATLSGERK